MSSNPPDQKPLLRTTGDGSLFLNRVQQAANQKIADATQQRSVTIGNANAAAAATVADAHRSAAEVLQPRADAVYALTDQGLFRSDMQGKCDAPLPLGGAASFAIDLAAQRLYWSELHVATGKGSPAASQAEQVAVYSAPSFQGTPNTFVFPLSPPDPGYTPWFPMPLNFLPAAFQVSSVQLAANSAVTFFEKPDGTGRTRMFTDAEPNVVNDWPIDATTSCAVSPAYHVLMSARLDGTDRQQLAALPEFSSTITNSGAVALDSNRGLLFWFTPSGQIMKVDFAGGDPIVITKIPDPPTGRVGLALDTTNQVLYWSVPDMFGTAPYDGSQWQTLVVGATQNLISGPFPYPADWFVLGKPAVEIAVDAANNRMFCCNGQQIWRANLDGSPFAADTNMPTPNHVEIAPLFNLYASAWGLVFDQPNQMLYWLSEFQKLAGGPFEIDLWQMNVDPSFGFSDIRQSAKQVLTFTGISGHGTDIKLFGAANIAQANQAVQDAHGRYQAAQNQANETVSNAHQAAATTRQNAQTDLSNAHTKAAGDIAQAQQVAATNRQDAQTKAQQKQADANQLISDANADANDSRATANTNAQTLIAQKQQQANGIRNDAQAQLDAKRQQLQNT